MIWLFWLLGANVCIAVVESIYRGAFYHSFWIALPYIFIPMMLGQLCLFYGFRQGPSLFVCGSVFTLINVVFRIVNTYRLHEALNMYNWLGVAFLAASVLLLKVK